MPVSAGKVILGADLDLSVDFVWDIEGPKASPIAVGSFKVACKPCTVRQFHEFVFQQQGYGTSKWWDSADFHILQKRDQHMPATWSLANESDSGELVVHSSAILQIQAIHDVSPIASF